MSTHSFLKKGARYRFLGGSPSPDLVEDTWVFTTHDVDHSILRAELDQSSPLFQTLYNGGNYKLNVVLEDDIECTGIECLVDTLRVVKIGDVYFEFVLSPCIQLAFYNNGKKIQRLDNSKEGILCANPDLHVAREACCNQTNYREVRSAYVESGVTYLYDGERMTYATAEDRCDSLCTFSSISGGSGKEWFRKGYHWTNNDCGINVKVNP